MTTRTIRKHAEDLLLPLGTALPFLAVWQAGIWISGTEIFPSPLAVLAAFGELAHKGLLWPYMRDSLFRVGSGYIAAVLLGIPVGLLLGWYPLPAASLNPVIQILRPISPLAWMPLAVIWFGVGDLSPIFLIFLAALFPILVAAMNAVRNIPAVYLQAGKNFGLKPAHLFLRVILPSVLPQTLNGLRIALGIAWLVVVAAEMIAVNSGLGYLILDSRNAGKRYDLVVAGMLLIGMVGLVLDILMRRAESLKLIRWGFRSNGV